ncbi:MAG: TerD family protein [Synergistaceae bacterium]|jgi:stress response protein SCP2|nr:TerD family protein [Synergistaceae bacterium]
MAINLIKGQKIDLTKSNPGLKAVMVGLGWDPNPGTGKFDCDASAFVLSSGKLKGDKDAVSFVNLKHKSGCVVHQGDNLTGKGEGDDEKIFVDLAKLPAEYDRVVFVVNIYQAVQRHQHFGMIRNAFIRLVDTSTEQELMRYSLSDDYSGMTAMIFGEVYRHNSEWKFAALGQGTNDAGIPDLARRYQ